VGRQVNIEQEILAIAARKMSDQIDIDVLKALGVYKDVELIRSSGTVYGLRYYTVEPRNLEWQETSSMWEDMMLWCFNQFGETGDLWRETKNLTPEPNQRWYANDRKFWFRNEEDLLMFVLRWA
jgi:hypothetical protein